MSITGTIDGVGEIIFTVGQSSLIDQELLDYKDKLIQHADYRTEMSRLIDTRALNCREVTAEGVRQIVQHDFHNIEKVRNQNIAVVATEDHIYGIARMYELLSSPDGPVMAVFRDMIEAKKWLEISWIQQTILISREISGKLTHHLLICSL